MAYTVTKGAGADPVGANLLRIALAAASPAEVDDMADTLTKATALASLSVEQQRAACDLFGTLAKIEERSIAKVGRKISSDRLERLHQAHGLLTQVIAEASPPEDEDEVEQGEPKEEAEPTTKSIGYAVANYRKWLNDQPPLDQLERLAKARATTEHVSYEVAYTAVCETDEGRALYRRSKT